MSVIATDPMKLSANGKERNEVALASSQGVRDFPTDKTTLKPNQNEDIDDVYEYVSSNEPIHFNTNKEAISKPVVHKRRNYNAKIVIDLDKDPFELDGRDFISHQYNVDIGTYTIEEKISFVNSENQKLMIKVDQLAEGLKTVISKMNLK